MRKFAGRFNLSRAQGEIKHRLTQVQTAVGGNSMVQQLALAPRSIGRRVLTALAIASVAAVIAFLTAALPATRGLMRDQDFAMYDSFFRHRGPQSKQGSQVVMVMADDGSLERMKHSSWKARWPWPRDTWAAVIPYLEKCGAREIVFDLTFDEPSFYQRYEGDDEALAHAIDSCTIPLVIAQRIPDNGQASFALPTSRPVTFGVANIVESPVRTYSPRYKGQPTLAMQAMICAHLPIPSWANQPFYLHYYGKSDDHGRQTFEQLPALDVVLAAQDGAAPSPIATSNHFKDKIVLIGASAVEAFDLKSSPLDQIIPGTETVATAISNMIDELYVHPLGALANFAVALAAAVLAAGGAVIPQKVYFKVIAIALSLTGLFAAGYLLFTAGYTIYWLPLAMPALAVAIATVCGLGWTYLIEDRQRRVLRRFLAQYVSPDVAAKLDALGTVSLGGVRRELSMLFTDIAGFTDLSEQLTSDELEKFMNFYLSEMSGVVFANNGTLDKYIGDALMTFWNAPLDQVDHAVLACRTALGMHRREEEIRPLLKTMKAGAIHTRIGLNTGLANVGNYGSLQKLNYTVLGDNVNLASRLEGANKIYGSNILVAEPTVEMTRGKFLYRPLDLLRVKGKQKPMAVFELLAEGNGTADESHLSTEFAKGLAAYQNQNWDLAEATFVALKARFPDDAPSAVFLKRVRDFRTNPPPPDWDGVHVAKDK